jgi:hypothetical protein
MAPRAQVWCFVRPLSNCTPGAVRARLAAGDPGGSWGAGALVAADHDREWGHLRRDTRQALGARFGAQAEGDGASASERAAGDHAPASEWVSALDLEGQVPQVAPGPAARTEAGP